MAATHSNEIHVSNEDEFNETNKNVPLNITQKKKITIEVDEDDPCLKDKKQEAEIAAAARVPGSDPRQVCRSAR